MAVQLGKGKTMDYSKSGGPKGNGREPRPVHHGDKSAPTKADPKAALLARIKAAAEARKK